MTNTQIAALQAAATFLALQAEAQTQTPDEPSLPRTADVLPDLLTVAEAAAYLRLAPQTIRNWGATDRGPASIKVGGRRLYHRSAVLAFAEVKAAA